MNKIKMVLKNIRYFIPLLIKINPLSIITMVLTAVFSSLSSLVWVVFPKMIIEELTGEQSVDYLIKIVLIFVLSVFALRCLSTICNNIQYYYNRKADFLIDEMFNQKITSIDYFYIEDPKFADQLSYAQKCLSQYSSGIYSVTWALSSIIENIITIAGVAGIILYSGEFWVIFVTIIGVVFNTYVYGKYQDYDEEYNKTIVRHNRKQWYYNNSMMGFRLQKDLRSYNAKELINDISSEEDEIVFKSQSKTSKKMMRLDVFNNIFIYFFTRFLTIAILAYSIYYKNSTIAVFTMLYSGVQTLDSSFSNMIYSLKSYLRDCSYQDNYINLMNIETVFKDGKQPLEHIESIEFKNVSFKYPRTDNYILKDVSFKISNKEKISLVGLNGAGKTTLIKLLCRFFEVKEGEILVNGLNINNYKHDDYLRQMAVVFQDFKIISFNLKDNIANTDDNQEKLYDALKRAQALDKVLSLPNKENTYINKWFDRTGIEFSGGEMQKFALARALYKDSDLMILDEPTSALDPIAEAEIYYHFNEVVGKKLTFFISHRLSSCIFSDRIMVLDGNKIAEIGTHKELMSNPDGLYHKMFTAQAQYYKE